MSLATGARIQRHQWVEAPLSDSTIAHVHAIALNEGHPLIQDSGLVVKWWPDHPIDDAEYNLDYEPPAQEPPDPDLDLDAEHYNAFDPQELLDDAAFMAPGVPYPAPGAEPPANVDDEEEEDEDEGIEDEDQGAPKAKTILQDEDQRA
jgi:hypothetical protein